MILGSLDRLLPFAEMWWYYLGVTLIFATTIGEIYFCRAVLAMMRGNKESKSAQQAMDVDSPKPFNLAPNLLQ